jgi:hypothetical protein
MSFDPIGHASCKFLFQLHLLTLDRSEFSWWTADSYCVYQFQTAQLAYLEIATVAFRRQRRFWEVDEIVDADIVQIGRIHRLECAAFSQVLTDNQLKRAQFNRQREYLCNLTECLKSIAVRSNCQRDFLTATSRLSPRGRVRQSNFQHSTTNDQFRFFQVRHLNIRNSII